MAEALDHLKKDYRARFCHGGGERIDLQQSQNLMKLIQDCFESGNSDLKTNSPSCSTLILKNEEGTSVQSQRPKPESASSVKRARKSADPSTASLLKPVSSRGHSCESHLKPATHDNVAASEKPESSVSKSEKKSTIKDEALCQHPAVLLGSEDNCESARSPIPVEEVKNSPVVKLHFDNWSMPATAESHAEVENLEGPQPGRDEKVVPVQGAECFVTSSAQSEEPFSSAILAAVATRTLGQRYSTSISPPSPCPVKHQDIEIEDECEFLIDESSGASSWISIPTKNKKSKSNGSAIPISKSQPSEKEKTQNKEVKNRKVQVKAHTKQKLDHLDVGTFDFKEMSESDPIPEIEENVLTSQSQKSTRMGKTKKDALRQDSPNQKKSGLETKPSYEEQGKTGMLPSEDLPMPSCGHQEEQTVSLKMSLRSSKNQQLASKASQDLDEKEQNAKQKLPKVEVAKRGTVSPRKKPKKSVQQSSSKKRQLQREELSDSESSEEELEREPIKLNKVCTTPLHQELETPVIEKLTKSLDKKEQTAKQKLPKVEVAKRGTVSPRKKPKKSVQQSSSKKRQLQREELSDSESSEEELEREPIKLNKVCTTPLHQELETPVIEKLTKSLDKKEQTARQKLPKVEVAKRGTVSPRKKPKKSVQQSSSKKRQLQREELSDSESSEEELEREPIKLNKVCTTPLHQELETPVIEKLTKSLDKKEQTARQKLPKVEVAKRGTVSPRKKPKKSVQQSSSKKRQLQREELSDSESSEEELEREPIKLNKVCTTPLHQELETPVIEKLTKSLDKKEQTAKQKLPKVEVAKRGTVSPRKKPKKSVQQSSSKKRQLQREELSDSESSEEELEREPIKLNKVCTTPLHQELETPVTVKLTKSLDKKEQTARQKLPKVEVAKRGTVSPRKKPKKSVQQSSSKKRQLQREELSDSESSEEELEREPIKLNKVCTTPLHQELETPVIQKLTKSKKPGNVLHAPESPVGANTATPLEALQHPMESVKNPEKKRLSAKSSEKIPRKIPCRASKALCSSSEDTGSQTDTDSSSVQDMPRKKPKLSDVKIKSNKRKHNRQHGPQDSFVAEKAVSCKSGPALEDYDKFACSGPALEDYDKFACSGPALEDYDKFSSSTESPGQDDTSSVMPSNTPNVRRTKRIRLRPLEYWRGERINYTMDSSGGLVISGIVHPETESPRKSKMRKNDHPKQERDETSRRETPASLEHGFFVSSDRREILAGLEHGFFVSSDRREIPAGLEHSLADASKPAIVLDPVTNREVPLGCINIAGSRTNLLKSEAVEIYKDFNTSLFATGLLVLKPHKEKGQQCVSTDTVAFRIIRGQAIVTLHKASYYLAVGDCFYIPAGNKYNIRNLHSEDSVFLFTQIKDR
ncbi:centromere protein C isoform 2-T4 [Acridotheres tristis]